MSAKWNTYEITFAWRNKETGELHPEFTRTQIAWIADHAVESAEQQILAEQDAHPDFGLMEPINELELRGVMEITTSAVDNDADVTGYDDSNFKSLLA